MRDITAASDNFTKHLKSLEDTQRQNYAAMQRSQDHLEEKYQHQFKALQTQHQVDLDRIKAANDARVK